MSETRIKLEPLTQEAFAPYGDVIEIDGAKHFPINGDTIERYHDLANVDVGSEAGGRTLISIMVCTKTSELPYRVRIIERHPLGSQAFIPMEPIPMAILVAQPGDNPAPSDLRGFLSNGTQGVNYHRGVWHMPLISSRRDHQYLIVDRGGAGHNCDELNVEHHQIVIDG